MSSKGAAITCQLGLSGPKVFPLALGCMGMSGMYGHADENESIATIHCRSGQWRHADRYRRFLWRWTRSYSWCWHTNVVTR
jgi:hypothetical protein